jgi:hypothetical protein
MKVRTLVASVTFASALPLASWATQPTGPQGVDWYGRMDTGTAAAADVNRDGVISRGEYASSGDTRDPRRGPYSGPSWETNPPVPAP